MKFSKRPPPTDFGTAQATAETPEPAPLTLEPATAEATDAPFPALASTAQPPAPLPDSSAEFAPSDPAPAGWPIWLTAFAVSVLWALGPIAFAIGYRNKIAPFNDDAFALLVFALLAIGPAIFVWGAAYMIRQGQKLAHEARRAKAMAEDMLHPSLVAAARAGLVAAGVRDEIHRAGVQADEAREALLALRDVLALQTDELVGAAAHSLRTAESLTDSLGRERAEMGSLAQILDGQASKIADAIGQQARMVSDAAQLAETQIREAETALSARAADLAAAAGEISTTTRTAGEDLTRHIARLETAGVGVSEQVKAVEAGLSEQRTALVTLSSALRADNESFARDAEAHAEKLSAFIATARTSAEEMAERAMAGGESLRSLMADAALQFRDLAETAKAEREEFGQSTLQSFEAVSTAAAEERAKMEAQTRAAIDALAAAAEETRRAAASHAATAREQVDQLSEAAFTAGQKANQVFEARLEEARALVDQSSKLVEEAGAATARKLDEGAAAARATMDELAAMLGDVEARAAQLPAVARSQADQVRAALDQGVQALMQQARRTAEEAQNIDLAFQERVRRNFEMLSEAVRLMGAVAAAPAAPAPAAAAPAPPAAPVTAPVGTLEPPIPEADLEPETLELHTPLAPEPDGAALADRLGLRQRLKLTPTATDAEFSRVFAAASGRPPEPPAAADEDGEEGGETWTWKDLLASLDGEDGEGQRLEADLASELARMGVEPAKLLPRARIDEVAAAVQTGDVEGAREVVRKLAPAATRRIARRLFTDDDVKRRTEIYVRRFKTLMDDAMVRDPQGFVLADLLGDDSGRLFLLLDAAGGDML